VLLREAGATRRRASSRVRAWPSTFGAAGDRQCHPPRQPHRHSVGVVASASVGVSSAARIDGHTAATISMTTARRPIPLRFQYRDVRRCLTIICEMSLALACRRTRCALACFQCLWVFVKRFRRSRKWGWRPRCFPEDGLEPLITLVHRLCYMKRPGAAHAHGRPKTLRTVNPPTAPTRCAPPRPGRRPANGPGNPHTASATNSCPCRPYSSWPWAPPSSPEPLGRHILTGLRAGGHHPPRPPMPPP